MMDFVINGDELEAMYGLPHIQQLTYLRGIRPYMDVKTGLAGIKRRISHQSIAEQLYIEPHQGIKSQSFSRDQVRRAVSGLVRAGMIEVQSEGMQLILKCPLATRTFSVQNKAAINPPHKATINPHGESLVESGFSGSKEPKTDIAELPKAAIPLKEDNYIYLLSQFEQFWSLYPEKKSKHKAQAAFEQLNPDIALFRQLIQALQNQINHIETMKLSGAWVPPWKYPANWLTQRCWEDEHSTDALQEKQHAKHTKNTGKRNTTTDLFCPPCETESDVPRNNVIQFQRYS
ncbi:hypothetical protein [Legionella londiniensis]|uniref:Legionella vir region protein n=1 Tax=Legionella londiniensis TaxID=45068 RepID=A0A0W0VJ27_9GAMM|nr:hypothetical protein [Legionella londiniensis]KTD20117.1 hypothetical protein Llon_1738 [Legionella londiniensis]STX94284.1 Legionella vir region protein [Legionella londiniensis]